MKFSIDDRIFAKFPDLCVGVVLAAGIDNYGTAEELWPLVAAQQEWIRENIRTETLSQLPRIASWRKAYSAFGAKPKKYKSSVESLYRSILKGRDLRHINTIVDVYNYISIKHMVPAGGDDVSRVEGDIALRFAVGGEKFRPLNAEVVEFAQEGEVIYTDDVEVLCRRWNWRECDKTKMTEETNEAILVVEGLPPVDRDEVESILAELDHVVERFCGGTTRFEILCEGRQEIDVAAGKPGKSS